MNIFKIDIRMTEENFGYDIIEIPKQYQFITIINNTDNSICLYPSYVTEPIPNLCMFRVPEYTTMTFPRVLQQTDYTVLWANDHGTPGVKQAYILLSDVNLQLNFSYSINNILNQGIDVNIVNPLPAGTNLIGQVDVSDRAARQLGIVSLTGSIPAGSNVIGAVDVSDRAARQLGIVSLTGSIPAGSNVIGAVDVSDRAARQLGIVSLTGSIPAGSNVIGAVDVSDRAARQLGIVSLTGSIPAGSNVIGAVDVSDRAARQLGQVNAYITGNANQNTWTLTGSADNAAITLTKAGVTGQSHYITGIMAGYSQVKTGLLQIKDGVNVILEQYIVNADIINLNIPIKLTAGNALTAILEASGTAGTIGKLNIVGFTM